MIHPSHNYNMCKSRVSNGILIKFETITLNMPEALYRMHNFSKFLNTLIFHSQKHNVTKYCKTFT